MNNIKIAVLHYKFLVMLTKKYNKKGHISQEEREEEKLSFKKHH